MNVGVSSAILASIIALTVAIAILFRRPRRPLYSLFSVFSFALFLWHAASLVSPLAGFADLLMRCTALAIPPTAGLFFAELLRAPEMRVRGLRKLPLVLSTLLIGLNLSPWGHLFAIRAVTAAYVLGALTLVMKSLWNRIRRLKTEPERSRLRYLFWGGVGALVLASGELFPSSKIAAAMAHIGPTIYLYFLYQSIIARRLIDVVEFLGKAAVLAVLTLVLATVYAVLVLWVGTEQHGLWLFNTLVASFVILILYDQVRPWIEEYTARILFSERFELQQLTYRLSRTLRTTTRLEQMRDRVLDSLHGSGRAAQVSMYLADEGELAFRLFGHRGAQPPRFLSLTQQPALLQEVRRERRPILIEQLTERYTEVPASLGGDATSQREQERIGEAIASMRLLGANVVIPMLVEERVVGFLAIGHEQLAGYSADELASLLSIAEACAVVIENSQEYEKRRERDRLVAIGEMAAGMAHEIRNPLGAIKGAAQCLDPHRLPSDAIEFVNVIIEEVDRLNRVLSQFLEYAKPFRGEPVPTDVNIVVAATVRLLGRDAVPEHVRLQQDLAHDLPQVSIDPEQLKQVLINLIRNATQAMPEGGQIFVSTGLTRITSGARRAERDEDLGSVYIRVRDTGPGISPEDVARIFVPFYTTKPNGTGLGLAISQRIIENAGGRIEVTSRLGEGSVFTLRLPVLVEEPEVTPAPPAKPDAAVTV